MWQTKLGRCIYTSSSGYKVYQNGFYRWLTLGSCALQTVINRYYPHRAVLHYLPALTMMLRAYPSDACLLGLGGAGIPHMLANNPDISLTVVDSSAEVIQIARDFFFLDAIKNTKVIHMDAIEFLRQSTIRFPHILVDLYDAHQFPIPCKNEQFFMLCKERVAADGFVAFNLANSREHWQLLQLIKKQFAQTVVIPVKHSANVVVVASQSEDKELFINLLLDSGQIKKIMWVESWGCVGQFFRPFALRR